MIKKLFKRFTRAPVPAVAILLFAAIISVIICALHVSNEAEIRNYEEVFATVPVKVTVTNLAGTSRDNLKIPIWVLNVLTGRRAVPVPLDKYVKDVQIKCSIFGEEYRTKKNTDLRGITSLSCENSILPENGCVIAWNEGYDESIFSGEEAVCIIPRDKTMLDNGTGEVVLDFTSYRGEERYAYQCTLKIVGTYTGGDEVSVYCPYLIVDQVYSKLKQSERQFDSISATLADNSYLEEFREIMTYWFVEPSPLAYQIPWDKMGYDYYPYALDIDDAVLQKTKEILEDSIKFNRTVTVFVVILSVVAGFLIGFLMIRRRKREIMLMRMVGESNARVYIGFALEQMICILLGIALGGSYYNWNPIKNLAIFAAVYFVALSLALAIFLNSKLLTAVKEDE